MQSGYAVKLKKLFEAAKKARTRAHAPYSEHSIGAAIYTKDGKLSAGCNIENASFGGTVCAERVAVWKAVSEGYKTPIQEVCVVSDAKTAWPPCGFCRQVLAEFATPDTLIHLANLKGIQKTYRFGDLLPHAFDPDHMK
ncbi:MAG: cytidine deaminase [Bdellovibrionaceae bacterium]|nr:cytidine deaminase [Pseudobdellovibrionaceae bacterium]